MRCATPRAIRPGPWASPARAGIGTWPCRSVSPWTGTARPDRALCRRGGPSGRRAGGSRRVRTAADPRGVLCRARPRPAARRPPVRAPRQWQDVVGAGGGQRKPRRTSRSLAGRRSSPRWVGESEAHLRQVFARARAHHPLSRLRGGSLASHPTVRVHQGGAPWSQAPRQCRLCTSLQLAIGPARYTRNLCPGIVYLPSARVDFGFKSGFFPYGHRPARIIGSMFSASVLGQNLKLRWPRV